MNIINKGISSFFQPLISYLFNHFLGDFIDSKNIDLSNLTLNGVNDIELDVDKLNKKFFKNNFFLLEKAKIGKLRVYYSFLNKKISIIVEDLEISVFLNEDIFNEKKQEKKRKKSVIEKKKEKEEEFKMNEENNKKLIQTFKDYLMDIKINNLQVNIRPNRTTCGHENFQFVCKEVLVSKSKCNEEKKNDKNELFFKMKVNFNQMGLFLVVDNSKEISSNLEEKKILPVLILDENIFFEINISLIADEIKITINNKIKEIIFLLNPQVIRIFFTFYLKIANFENSKLLSCKNAQEFEDLLKKSFIEQKIENNFGKFLDNFNINFSSDIDESFIKNSQDLLQKTKIYTKINIKKINILYYNPSEFKEIDIIIKNNMIEEDYLNVFPFCNHQISIKKTELILKKKQIFIFIQKLKFSHLLVAQKNNLDNSSFNLHSRTFNTSSLMLQSMMESTYEVEEIFCLDNKEGEEEGFHEILKDHCKGRKNSMNVGFAGDFDYFGSGVNEKGFGKNKEMDLGKKNEDFEKKKFGKNFGKNNGGSFGSNSGDFGNGVDDEGFDKDQKDCEGNRKSGIDKINDTGFLIKFKNDKLSFIFKYIFLETDNFLVFGSEFLECFVSEIQSYLLKIEKNKSKNLEEIEKKFYFSNFVNYLENKEIFDLKKQLEIFKKPRKLLLDLDLCIYLHIQNFKIKSEIFQDIFEINNLDLKLFPLPQDRKNTKFQILEIENIKILKQINLKNLKAIITDYDKENHLMDFKIIIDFFNFDTNLEFFFSKITYFMNNKEKIDHFLKEMQSNFEVLNFFTKKLTNLYEIFPEKKKLNEKLNILSQNLFPEFILSTNQIFNINKLSFLINDKNLSSLNFLNNLIKKSSEKLKKFLINVEISLSEKRYDDINLLDLKIDNFFVYLKKGRIQNLKFSELSFNFFEFWKNDLKNFFMNSLFQNFNFEISESKKLMKLDKIKFNINSSKKRINILIKLFLEFYYQEKISKMIDFFKNYLLESNLNPNLQKKNLFEKDKKLVNNELFILFVKDIELNLYEFLLNLNFKIENLEIKNEEINIPKLMINKINCGNDDSIFQMKNLKLFKKEINILKININLPIYLIKIILEFQNYVQKNIFENLKKTFEKIEQKKNIKKKKKSDEKFKSFIVSEKEKKGGFQKISSFWEIFQDFNTIIKKNKIKNQKELLTLFKNKINSKKILDINFFLSELNINLIEEDDSNFKFIFLINNILVDKSENENYIIIENFKFYIEKGFNKDLILTNIENDFFLKIFLKVEKDNKLNFFINLDDIKIKGEKKLWETLDNQIKKLLKQFLKEKEDFSEFTNESKNELIYLGECILNNFSLIFKIVNSEFILNVDSTNSLEIFSSEIVLDQFLELFISKLLGSIKKSCKILKFGTTMKFVFFFLWRIIHFIFLKRNIYKVHKSFYLIIKEKIKCKFI